MWNGNKRWQGFCSARLGLHMHHYADNGDADMVDCCAHNPPELDGAPEVDGDWYYKKKKKSKSNS